MFDTVFRKDGISYISSKIAEAVKNKMRTVTVSKSFE